MDIISSLTAFGTYLNTKIEKPIDLEYDTIVKRTPINGINIYNSTNYRDNKNYMDDLAYKRYKGTQNPRESGLIPNFYNQFKDVALRNEERQQKFMEEQKKKNAIILEKQIENVGIRNLKYKQIFLYGFIPFIFLLLLLYYTI
jgi:hypothetical protein